MGLLRRVSILSVLFLILVSSQALAGMQKPTVDEEHGCKVSLPDRWVTQPIPPATDYDALGVSGFFAKLFENEDVIPLLIYKGPQDCEYRLFKIKAESLDKAVETAQEFADMKRLGKPLKIEDFKVSCSKTKCKTMKFTSTGSPSDGWDDGTFAHHYFVMGNENGYFLGIYIYFVTYKKYEKEIFDSAKTFGYTKIKEGAKNDPNKMPAGWSVLETANYKIQYNETDATKVKNFGERIEKLHAAHVKVIPPNSEMEKMRPKTLKNKFSIKYFKDKAGFDGYASDNHVWGAAAWYSPGKAEIVFYLTGWSKETLAILYHECTHQYLHEFVGGPKVDFHTWIDEGLAEYFFAAGMEEADKIILGSIHKDARNTVKTQIRNGEQIPVKNLVEMTQSEYYDIGRRAYDYGWALVHFFINSKNKQYNEVIPSYFKELQAIVFPVLNELEKTGVNLGDFDFDWTKDLGKEGEVDLDELDKKAEEREKRRELREKLENAYIEAQKKAFAQIDFDQLQKDWEDFYK